MFRSKPFYITSKRREELNKVNPDELLLALIEKYKYNIEVNPHNRKEAYKMFYREHKLPKDIFRFLTDDAIKYIAQSGTSLSTLLAGSKELDKYLVYLWQERVL